MNALLIRNALLLLFGLSCFQAMSQSDTLRKKHHIGLSAVSLHVVNLNNMSHLQSSVCSGVFYTFSPHRLVSFNVSAEVLGTHGASFPVRHHLAKEYIFSGSARVHLFAKRHLPIQPFIGLGAYHKNTLYYVDNSNVYSFAFPIPNNNARLDSFAGATLSFGASYTLKRWPITFELLTTYRYGQFYKSVTLWTEHREVNEPSTHRVHLKSIDLPQTSMRVGWAF